MKVTVNSKCYVQISQLVLLLLFAFMFSGCGKRGPLIYPDMLTPAAPVSVTALQYGTEVKLSFVLPQRDQAGRRLNGLVGVDIYRRSALSGLPADCSSCTVDYALFKKIYLTAPAGSIVRNGNQVVLIDSDVRPGRDYYYYVLPFTTGAIAGKSSQQVKATVTVPSEAPVLSIRSEPTEVVLTVADKAAVSGLVGYNFYRAVKGEAFTVFPHNREIVKGGSFTDIGLNRGVRYIYVVRKVLKRPDGSMEESGVSNVVEAQLSDE